MIVQEFEFAVPLRKSQNTVLYGGREEKVLSSKAWARAQQRVTEPD